MLRCNQDRTTVQLSTEHMTGPCRNVCDMACVSAVLLHFIAALCNSHTQTCQPSALAWRSSSHRHRAPQRGPSRLPPHAARPRLPPAPRRSPRQSTHPHLPIRTQCPPCGALAPPPAAITRQLHPPPRPITRQLPPPGWTALTRAIPCMLWPLPGLPMCLPSPIHLARDPSRTRRRSSSRPAYSLSLFSPVPSPATRPLPFQPKCKVL